ncbi:hypothetical protein D3C71_1526780 [compost metagenome]
MRHAMAPPGLLHCAHHARQRRDRVVLQAERQRQQEHHLGIGGPFQRPEIRRRDHQHQIAAQERIVADHAVVHEQPLPVPERMAIGFLRGRIGGRADVRHEQGRMDCARRFAQIAVVPGRMHAAIAKRRL